MNASSDVGNPLYKEPESRELQMKRDGQVETVIETRLYANGNKTWRLPKNMSNTCRAFLNIRKIRNHPSRPCGTNQHRETWHQLAAFRPTSYPFHAIQSWFEKKELWSKQEVEQRLAEKVVEPAQIGRDSLIDFAQSKMGHPASCSVIKRFNILALRYLYSVPRTNGCTDVQKDATVLSSVFANSRYSQIEVHEADWHMTEFISQTLRLSIYKKGFGLRNASGTF